MAVLFVLGLSRSWLLRPAGVSRAPSSPMPYGSFLDHPAVGRILDVLLADMAIGIWTWIVEWTVTRSIGQEASLPGRPGQEGVA